jgi:EAL domain-containing protein (putative c-di-GMP-specific phosphodiesterase class I)
VRAIDTVARFGGDEFVVLLEEVEDIEDVLQVTGRIQSEVAEPLNLEGHTVFVSASIGIRLSGMDQQSAGDVLRDADIAMYYAKISGKARHKMFDVSMRDHAVERIELENDMRRALERNAEGKEFFLCYQPIVSLGDGKVTGFEALARWRHPLKGFISPRVFIPIAEETGLIYDLGRWVMFEACRQIQAWNMTFKNDPPYTISVNLSARQFAQADLIQQITQVLRESGLPPQCLKLEITESVLIDDPDSVSRLLEELRRLGVQLQIDDFGTGYSSLSYLHRLPIDALKIDRSFINKLMDRTEETPVSEVVRTIITMAWGLNIKVVAEGVESQEQYAWLKGLGCNYAQGFLIAEPLEPAAVENFFGKEHH